MKELRLKAVSLPHGPIFYGQAFRYCPPWPNIWTPHPTFPPHLSKGDSKPSFMMMDKCLFGYLVWKPVAIAPDFRFASVVRMTSCQCGSHPILLHHKDAKSVHIGWATVPDTISGSEMWQNCWILDRAIGMAGLGGLGYSRRWFSSNQCSNS